MLRAKTCFKYNATTFMTILWFCRNISQSQPRRVLQYNATTFRMTILFFCREISILSLGQAVFSVLKQRTIFRMTILFFYREIYAQSQPVRVLLTKIQRIPFGSQSYSFIEKYKLSLSQGVFQLTKIADFLSDDNHTLLQRNIYTYSWTSGVLVY